MAAVRLHTQHHPAGGLRPATPTCCSCCCCCLGSSIGTLAVLPVMITWTAADQQHGHPPVPSAPAGESPEEPETVAPPAPTRGLPARAEGLAAFGLAAVPFLAFLIWGDSTAVIIAFVTTVLALTAWAAIRMSASGGIWVPFITTLLVLPLAFGTEFYLGLGATSDSGSNYYWLLATAIGAIVFGLGILFTWRSRHP